MTKRNEQGQLTSDPIGSVAPEKGLIDHIRDLDARIGRIEDNIWPNGDGSGTGRYREGTNWTQVSDGTDYPGSYGVGPDLVVGDSVRVVNDGGDVDPVVHVVTEVNADRITFEVNKAPVVVKRAQVVKVLTTAKPGLTFTPFVATPPEV